MLYFADMSYRNYEDYTEILVVKDFATPEDLQAFIDEFNEKMAEYVRRKNELDATVDGYTQKNPMSPEDHAKYRDALAELRADRHVLVQGVYFNAEEQTDWYTGESGYVTRDLDFIPVDEYIRQLKERTDKGQEDYDFNIQWEREILDARKK